MTATQTLVDTLDQIIATGDIDKMRRVRDILASAIENLRWEAEKAYAVAVARGAAKRTADDVIGPLVAEYRQMIDALDDEIAFAEWDEAQA